MSQALVIIRPLILRMDPFKKVIWKWSNLLTMLSFGLAFIGVPSVTVWLLKFGRDISTKVPIAAGIFAVSLEASPMTIRLLLPNVQGLQSQLVQEAELDDMLSRAAQPLEQMMNNALHFLMTDLPSFVRFVECELNCAQLQEKTLTNSAGQFSGPGEISLPEKTAGLDFALKTYMTSVALTANGWLVSPDTQGFYDSFADACPQSTDGLGSEYNICSDHTGAASYWSPDTGRLYSLYKPDDLSQVNEGTHFDTTDLLLDIVNHEWAALNVLFDGSYNCTAGGQHGVEDVSFNWDGSLNIACTSQLTQIVSCREYCPVLSDGTCPFREDDGQCNGQNVD